MSVRIAVVERKALEYTVKILSSYLSQFELA